MKKYMYITMIGCIISCLISCEKDLLQKPMGSDLNVDSIFSTREKAMSAIAQAYANTASAGIYLLNGGDDQGKFNGMSHGTLGKISGELNALKYNWEECYRMQRAGMNAGSGGGKAMSCDGYDFNYTSIRSCFLVMENIDKVEDMNQNEKDEVKAEMKALIAYRYGEMFKRYGGVSIIRNALQLGDEVMIPRAPLQEVLDYIIELCDDAVKDLPSSWPDNMKGRATKGVATAVKAEALIYAARPLFNSSIAYLPIAEEHKNLICFGNESQTRWQDAINASEAVITWALANNHKIINTGNPLDDYGTAVATPNNAEVLFAYKRVDQYTDNSHYDPRREVGGANGMSFWMLKQYCNADGTEVDWPAPDNETRYPYAHYRERIDRIEPRYKASAAGAGIDAWNNPGSSYWNSYTLGRASSWEGRDQTEACGRFVKLWYQAGNRTWFEFPIYRLAEFYLNLAEAYNETGNPAKALENLNVIRDRAGLPYITETDKELLRKIIQREWAVEFYGEDHQIFDMKHWKHEDIGNGIIGGPKYSLWYYYIEGRTWAEYDYHYTDYSVREVYTGFWSPKEFLCPFPLREVNKGYLVQNPGY